LPVSRSINGKTREARWLHRSLQLSRAAWPALPRTFARKRVHS